MRSARQPMVTSTGKVLSADGARDHVIREIRDEEARGVQRVFALAGEGHGFAVIPAATMRAEEAVPRPCPAAVTNSGRGRGPRCGRSSRT